MTDKEKQKRRTEKREEIRKKWEPVWTILNLNANERDKLIALHQIADPQSGKIGAFFFSADGDGGDIEPAILSVKGFYLRKKFEKGIGWAYVNPFAWEDDLSERPEKSAPSRLSREGEIQFLKEVGLYELMNKNIITVRGIFSLSVFPLSSPLSDTGTEEDTSTDTDYFYEKDYGGTPGYKAELSLNLPAFFIPGQRMRV